jgi:hypothetical protein
MSLLDEATTQQVVYGPDGKAYGNPAIARAAGVNQYYREDGTPYPVAQQTLPMPAPSFGGMGSADPYSQIMGQMGGGTDLYSRIMAQMTPTMNPYTGAGQAIAGYDPSLYNNAFVGSNSRLNLSGLLGGGRNVNYGEGGTGISSNPGWESLTPAQQAAFYAANPLFATITQLGQKGFANTSLGRLQGLLDPQKVTNSAIIAAGFDPQTFTSNTGMGMGTLSGGTTYSNPQTIGIQDYANFGQVQSNSGMLSDSPTGGSIGETGMGVNSAGQTVSNDATIAAQDAANFGEAAGSSSSAASKIVCTAMNQEYGFGSFRNAIWLKYSESKLTKAHEVGYHALFLPLVDFGFKQGDGKVNLMVRKFLESCARHRSLDLRAEMRGTKRDPIGRAYRFVLEPLCYAVGKFKGY